MIAKEVSIEIGCLILTWETMQRNRNRMIDFMDKGDPESLERATAMIAMQKDDCWRYMEYLRNVRNGLPTPPAEMPPKAPR